MTEEEKVEVEIKKDDGDNTLAIIGFVLSFFVSIAGLICSAIALKNEKEHNYSNPYHGFAIAGLIISIVSIGLCIVIFGIFGCAACIGIASNY